MGRKSATMLFEIQTFRKRHHRLSPIAFRRGTVYYSLVLYVRVSKVGRCAVRIPVTVDKSSGVCHERVSRIAEGNDA